MRKSEAWKMLVKINYYAISVDQYEYGIPLYDGHADDMMAIVEEFVGRLEEG